MARPVEFVPLTAQTQQVLGQVLRQIEFSAVHMIYGVSPGHVKELGGRTELLPQLSGAGVSMTCLRRRRAFDDAQDRAKGTAKFELLVAGVRECPAIAPAGPRPFRIALPPPPLPSGRRTYNRPCPSRRPIFRPARLPHNVVRRARAGSL